MAVCWGATMLWCWNHRILMHFMIKVRQRMTTIWNAITVIVQAVRLKSPLIPWVKKIKKCLRHWRGCVWLYHHNSKTKYDGFNCNQPTGTVMLNLFLMQYTWEQMRTYLQEATLDEGFLPSDQTSPSRTPYTSSAYRAASLSASPACVHRALYPEN